MNLLRRGLGLSIVRMGKKKKFIDIDSAGNLEMNQLCESGSLT